MQSYHRAEGVLGLFYMKGLLWSSPLRLSSVMKFSFLLNTSKGLSRDVPCGTKSHSRESPWIHNAVHLHPDKISQSANPSEEKKGLLCHHHKKIKAIDLFSVLFLIELIFSSEKAASPNIVLG